MAENVQLTVITKQGSQTSGPMDDRSAKVVEALADMTGAITSRKAGT